MYINYSPFLAALASSVHAVSTPKGFKPSTNTQLDVIFNSTSVGTPGQLLSKSTTSTQPQLALPASQGQPDDVYMFVMLDLDVPPQNGSTERRVFLHAMTTGFKATQQQLASGSSSETLLSSMQKGPAMYMPPGPPATDSIPHRYVELLFQEPAELKTADFAKTSARLNFDLEKFMKENGMGEPVAANFFTVDGRANATSAGGEGTATGSGGLGANSTVPFTGGVGRRDVSLGLVGGVAGLVLAAMG